MPTIHCKMNGYRPVYCIYCKKTAGFEGDLDTYSRLPKRGSNSVRVIDRHSCPHCQDKTHINEK